MAKRIKGVPNLPFAPFAAVLFGLVAAILIFATPAWMLERFVVSTGLAGLVPAAAPPLGDTARTLMAVAMGGVTALFLWLVLRPIERLIHNRISPPKVRASHPVHQEDDRPDPLIVKPQQLNRTRKPIFAEAELGAPLMSEAALANGGELLLDQVAQDHEDRPQIILDAPAQVLDAQPAPQTAGAAIEWLTPADVTEEDVNDDEDETDVVEPERSPIAEPVSISTPIPTPIPTLAPAPAPAPEPEAAPEAEPSLRELLVRFETALKQKEALSPHADGTSASLPEGSVASLRDLIASSRLR